MPTVVNMSEATCLACYWLFGKTLAVPHLYQRGRAPPQVPDLVAPLQPFCGKTRQSKRLLSILIVQSRISGNLVSNLFVLLTRGGLDNARHLACDDLPPYMIDIILDNLMPLFILHLKLELLPPLGANIVTHHCVSQSLITGYEVRQCCGSRCFSNEHPSPPPSSLVRGGEEGQGII
jgi:hypothetical protein